MKKKVIATIVCVLAVGSLLQAPMSASDRFVSIPTRPFGVDFETYHAFTDGFFDITIDNQVIGVYLLNEGTAPITNATAVASFDEGSGIVLTDDFEFFGTLEPGVPVLGFFQALFGGASPGKYLLTLTVSGDDFEQTVSRHVFVVRSEHDPEDVNVWTMYGDVGKITTEVYSNYGGDNFGSLSALTAFKWTVEYYTPFEGQYSELPFSDPWWKAFGLGFGLGGCLGWVVGAVAEGCGARWGKTAKEVGQAEKAAGGLTVASDIIDPFRRGQMHTVPGPDEVTVKEEVEMYVEFHQEPLIGTQYSADVQWTYTRTTDVAVYIYSVEETVVSVHYTTSRDLTINGTEFLMGDTIVVTAEAEGPEVLNSNNAYFVADIFDASDVKYETVLRSVVLRDDGHDGDVTAGDGVYTGATTTDGLPVNTPLDVMIFGFDVNNASESDPPVIAAQEIGGVLISTPELGSCSIEPDFTITVMGEEQLNVSLLGGFLSLRSPIVKGFGLVFFILVGFVLQRKLF